MQPGDTLSHQSVHQIRILCIASCNAVLRTGVANSNSHRLRLMQETRAGLCQNNIWQGEADQRQALGDVITGLRK